MIKRAIKQFAAVLAVVVLFANAGCGRGGDAKEISDPSDSTRKATETLRIAWMESSKWGKDDIADRLKEKLGIDFEFVNLNWSDAINKLNVMIASGDVPDMFYYPALDEPSTKSVYIEWAERGVLKPLPEDLSAYPHIEKVMAPFDYMKIGGKQYSIPRLAWKPENQHLSIGLIVRNDYLKRAGFTEMPRTLDEFVRMLVAFRDDDPDGDGKADTIPFSPGSAGLLFLQNMFGLTNGWIKEDGRYVPAYISDKFLAYTKFIKKLYDEHLLDPDFATQVSDQLTDKFASGKIGAIGAQIEATSLKVNLFDKLARTMPDPYETAKLLPLVQGPYGDLVMTNQFNHYSATLFGAGMSDEKMAACLRLYDYLLSDEGLDLMRWGIEGEDYRLDGDKREAIRSESNASGLPKPLNVTKPTSNLKLLVSWDVDGGWDSPSLAPELVAMEKQHIAIYQPHIQQDAGARIGYMYDAPLDRFNYTDLAMAFFNNAVLDKYADLDAAFRGMVGQVMGERRGAEAIRVANGKVAELR